MKAFQKVQKDAEKLKDDLKKRSIEDLLTLSGQAKVHLVPGSNSSKFCTQMNDIAENYQILYREMIGCAGELTEKAADFSATLYNMQRLTG